MAGSPTLRERVFRGALGGFLAFAAYNVGLGSAGTEQRMLARGALVLAVVVLVATAAGSAGVLAMVGVGLLTRIPLRPSVVFGVALNSLFTFARALGVGEQADPGTRLGRGTA